MPYASKNSGFYCYPEPGDEVIVGFIEDNPCYPVILGSLHNPVNTSAFQPGDANKGWKLAKEGAELEMLLNTKDKNLLLKSGEQRLEVNDKSKEIVIESSKAIDISGKDSVDITGQKINMQQP